MTRVKICGCRTPEHALAAAEAGADFIGLMFVEQSRRRVTVEEAKGIVATLGPSVSGNHAVRPEPAATAGEWYRRNARYLEGLLDQNRPLAVGVFARQDVAEINEIVEATGIDLVQLHGDEPWDWCARISRPVIKVVHVAPEDDATSTAARIDHGAVAVMLEKADPRLGGTGESFDWRVAADLQVSLPIWLCGGLSPDNVAEAIAMVHPWCVDVSSGTETEGVKDIAKIHAFVRNAKAATAARV